ncbi:MAG: PQQ-binding-like beta-propeller repeat protein [Thermoguttaceae bacterium]
MKRLIGRSALSACLLTLAVFGPAVADDWPEWRGVGRDGMCRETGLLKAWPDGGPTLLWTATGVGEGYSGPAIVGDVLYTMGNLDGKECVLALDVTDGTQLWVAPFGPVEYDGNFPGTRATPTTDGDRLFALGASGRLVCMERADGKIVWTKNFVSDFGGPMPRWAFAESVLVDGERLICTPGGPKASMVALDKTTGRTVWASGFGDKAAYSSIVKTSIGGTDQYVAFTAASLVGVAAADGKLLWRYKEPAHWADWGEVNVVTPIVHDGTVCAASGYGVGGGMARIVKTPDGFEARQAWFTKDMKNHHGGLILCDGALYGCNDPSILTCLDYESGEVRWQSRKPGKCSLLYADGMLYCRDEKGPISLVGATPEGFRQTGRFDQPNRSDQNAWPHLVIANGRLYVRDQDVLLCYDVKEGR